MKNITLLAATVLLINATAYSATIPAKAGKHKYTPCMMPLGCGASGRTWKPVPQAAPKKEKPAGQKPAAVPQFNFLPYPNPMTGEHILKGEITSAIRLPPEQSGSKKARIIIIRRGGGSLSLPESRVPRDKTKAGTEVAKIPGVLNMKGQAPGQINDMNAKRAAIAERGMKAKTGVDRMWGEKSSPTGR